MLSVLKGGHRGGGRCRLRPRHRWWSLAIVGGRPDHRRRGHGTAFIAAGFRIFTARDESCLLETSTDRNVALYERSGFGTVASVRTDSASPPVTFMFRPESGKAS
jgi:GNAT superfamily N-acetyltransferase